MESDSTRKHSEQERKYIDADQVIAESNNEDDMSFIIAQALETEKISMTVDEGRRRGNSDENLEEGCFNNFKGE